MSPFVESLKRLHRKGLVSVPKLEEMLTRGEISSNEYDYIVDSDAT